MSLFPCCSLFPVHHISSSFTVYNIERRRRLLAVATCLIAATCRAAAPTVTWSSHDITRIMSAGFTGVEQVQFVSDGTIGNVDVVVDPNLQSYVG
jgi:hypothetical protein